MPEIRQVSAGGGSKGLSIERRAGQLMTYVRTYARSYAGIYTMYVLTLKAMEFSGVILGKNENRYQTDTKIKRNESQLPNQLFPRAEYTT